MPIVEFTHSERQWYAREATLGVQHVRKAEAEAAQMIGKTLADICESHNIEPPPHVPGQTNAELVKDKRGNVLGVVWGKEHRDWLAGETVIEGSVLPPGALKKKVKTEMPKSEAPKTETPVPPPADKTPVSQDPKTQEQAAAVLREVEKVAPAPNGAAAHS